MVVDDGTVKNHYFDASAMVKLVATDPDEEPGRAAVLRFFHTNGFHHTTSYCVVETLSALKAKWRRRRITQDAYIHSVREFFRVVLSGCDVEDVPLSQDVENEAERIMRTYQVDFVDSIQLVTVLRGRFGFLAGGSRSLFVTADRALAEAGRCEGARVWECTSEPWPL